MYHPFFYYIVWNITFRADNKYEGMMGEYRGSGGIVMEVCLSMKNPLAVDMKGANYQGNGERLIN